MNFYPIFFVVVLVFEGIIAKKAERSPILYFFAGMLLINTIFPFWLDASFWGGCFVINIIFGPMVFLAALGKGNASQNQGYVDSPDSFDFDSIFEESGENISSDDNENIPSDDDESIPSDDNENIYNEEGGNTESDFDEYSFSETEKSSEMNYNGKPELGENSETAETKKIGYNHENFVKINKKSVKRNI